VTLDKRDYASIIPALQWQDSTPHNAINKKKLKLLINTEVKNRPPFFNGRLPSRQCTIIVVTNEPETGAALTLWVEFVQDVDISKD